MSALGRDVGGRFDHVRRDVITVHTWGRVLNPREHVTVPAVTCRRRPHGREPGTGRKTGIYAYGLS